MEALLTKGWLGDLEPSATSIIDQASVSLAREAVRREGQAAGLPDDAIAKLAVVVSELAQNQLVHAQRGSIGVRRLLRDGVPGLEIVAADRGGGLRDPRAALRGAGKLEGSLGTGLYAARELSDEMDFDVREGEGTCVRARKFAGEVRRAREVGVYGLACPGERVSGDHAGFRREDDALHLAIADGLGHAAPAREAAVLAVGGILRRAGDLERALVEAHLSATGSRGAVVAAITVNCVSGELACAAVGDIGAQVERPRKTQRLTGTSGVVGTARPPPKPRIERATLGRGDLLIAYTDGISSRATIADDLDLLREPAIVIAKEIVTRFTRGYDDTLVLVVK